MSVSITQAVDEWRLYAIAERGQSKRSVVIRASRVGQFVRWYKSTYGEADPTIDAITMQQFRAYLQYLVEECGNCPTTVRGHMQDLRAVYKYTQESGYIEESAIHRLRLPKRSAPNRALVSDDEVRQMFAACRLLRPTIRAKMAEAILSIYVYGGLRTQELLSLTVGDVKQDGEDCYIQITCGKGGKRRVVPLHRDGIKSIKDYLSERPDLPYDRLWFGNKARHLSKSGLASLFGDIKWYAGIDRAGVKPHALRHNYATRLARADVNLYHIKEVLGHSDISTTVRYLHGDLQSLTEAMQKGGLAGEG